MVERGGQEVDFEDNARKLSSWTRQPAVTETMKPQNVFADRPCFRCRRSGLFHPRHGQAPLQKGDDQLPQPQWRKWVALLAKEKAVINRVMASTEPGVWRHPARRNAGERRGARGMVNSRRNS